MPARRLALLSLLLVAAFLPFMDVLFATPQERKARKVAFLVGVGKYDHAFTSLGSVPENDVTELAKELARGEFEVHTLTGSKPDADPLRATKKNVEARFKELLSGSGGKPALRDGDTLVVVLCGHGVQAEALDPTTQKKEAQPFFCPVDARPDNPDTMVPLNGLIRATEGFGATSLFLIDACREVTDPNRGTRSGIQGKKVNLPAKTAILFACGAGQLSHQSDKLGHGVFTHSVLRTLRGETGLTGEVSWTELVAGVEKSFRSPEVKALIPAGREQVPVLATGELNYTGLLAVKGTAAKEPAKKTDPVPMPGGEAAVNAKSDLIKPVEKTEDFEYILNDDEDKPLKGKRTVLTFDIGDGQKMEFVRIAAGEFTRGAAEEKESADDERPQRKVQITKAFYLGKFEVTQAQYKALMGKNPSEFKNDRFPVETVGWNDVRAFCKQLSEKTGRKFDLPTEAQWEYACRAGTKTPYHFGSKLNGDHANCDGNSPYGTHTGGPSHESPKPVGSYKPNPWGLHDMHGNVDEWCKDYWGGYPKVTEDKDPVQLENQHDELRVFRGGSWKNGAWWCRAAFRNKFGEDYRYPFVGFRVCFPAE